MATIGTISRHPGMSASGLGCVKTHTSEKCRKYNSPMWLRAASAQYDLTPLVRNFAEALLRACRALEFSHSQGRYRVKSGHSSRLIVMSANAVDGSSTRNVSATDVGALKAPTIQRGYACKRPRQSVSTSPNRSSRSTALLLLASGHPPSVEAPLRSDVLSEVAAVPDQH